MKTIVSRKIIAALMAVMLIFAFHIPAVTVTAAAPTSIKIMVPSVDGVNVTYATAVTFTTIASAASMTKVDYYLDDAELPFVTGTNATATQSISATVAIADAPTKLPAGDHVVKAIASDASGNFSEPVYRNITVAKVNINNIAGDSISLYNNYIYSLNYDIYNASPSIKRAELYIDDVLTDTQTTFIAGNNISSGSFRIDLSALITGNHSVYIKSYSNVNGGENNLAHVSAVKTLRIMDSTNLTAYVFADQAQDTVMQAKFD